MAHNCWHKHMNMFGTLLAHPPKKSVWYESTPKNNAYSGGAFALIVRCRSKAEACNSPGLCPRRVRSSDMCSWHLPFSIVLEQLLKICNGSGTEHHFRKRRTSSSNNCWNSCSSCFYLLKRGACGGGCPEFWRLTKEHRNHLGWPLFLNDFCSFAFCSY